MKRMLSALVLVTLGSLVGWTAAGEDPAAPVLERYLAAAGGWSKLQAVRSASASASIDLYGYRYDLYLLADGRFRIEAADRVTVHDGQEYWQAYHGIVRPVSGPERDRVRETSLQRIFFHGLLDAAGQPVPVQYAGRETVRGRDYDLLALAAGEGVRRTLYCNASSGLIEKLVELAPDPELRERKTIYTYDDYLDVGGVLLPTRFRTQCLTTGEEVQPLTVFADLKLNEPQADSLFRKPPATAPRALFADGELSGEVLALSGGGSLITNITSEDLAQLGVEDGTVLIAAIKGRETRHPFATSLDALPQIGAGDYLATYNGTPALWLVKAYVGMRSDDSTYAAGDPVRISVAPRDSEEVGE